MCWEFKKMANVWTKFRELLPFRVQMIGEVVTVHSDGTSTIDLPDGSRFRVVGDSVAVDGWALVEGNRIINEVPALPTYDAEV